MVNLPPELGSPDVWAGGVWVCSQAYYFAMSLSGCSSCFGCSVENGRLTSRTGPEQTTTQNPAKLPSKPLYHLV